MSAEEIRGTALTMVPRLEALLRNAHRIASSSTVTIKDLQHFQANVRSLDDYLNRKLGSKS
jgi:hypothetical protein